MIKKYMGITLIAASVVAMGCSSSNDDGGASDGVADAGVADAGNTDGGGAMPDEGIENSIVDVAVAAGDFTILAAALTQTGLDYALDRAGDYTVFAPNDAAFTAAGITADALPDNDVLINVLQYHVLVGAVSSADAIAAADSDENTVTAFNMAELPLSLDESSNLIVGAATLVEGSTAGATVITPDLPAANGVIHVVDGVIAPPEGSMAQPVPMAPEGGGDEGGMADGDMTDGGMADGGMTDGGGTPTRGAVETAFAGTAALSTSVEAYDAAMFGGSLDGSSGDPAVPNTWTLFAPSNEALSGLGLTAADLTSDELQRHINTAMSIDSAGLGAMTEIATNLGDTYAVVNTDGAITVGGFAVMEIATGQSTVYQIEGVLTPNSAAGN